MFGGAKWKQNDVPTYKFDLVDVKQFRRRTTWLFIKYTWLHCLVMKAGFVLLADIFTITTMFLSRTYSNRVFDGCRQTETDEDGNVVVEKHECVPVSYKIGKWIFLGCVVASFALLCYEAVKAHRILQSHDISLAYMNVMANRFLSMRSFDVFCLFARIGEQEKNIDWIALFVFFTFKSWKRILLGDLPRQIINAIALVAFYRSRVNDGPIFDIDKYTNGDVIMGALLVVMLTTVFLCAMDLAKLACAGMLYMPLLCHIQGNLKEYCCYRVDKRIANVVPVSNRWSTLGHENAFSIYSNASLVGSGAMTPRSCKSSHDSWRTLPRVSTLPGIPRRVPVYRTHLPTA